MATTDLVHFASNERARQASLALPPIVPSYHQLVSPARSAIVRGRRFLLGRMREDGGWRGEQRGDASLPSRLVMLLAYLGHEEQELTGWAANAILRDQAADGGWSEVPGGSSDLSVSVQAYFALKLTGHKPSRPHMVAARQIIRSLGGADRANATTRRFLTLFESNGPQQGSNLTRSVRELFIAPIALWPSVGDEPELGDLSFARFVGQAIAAYSAEDEERLRQFVAVDEEREEARPSLAISPELDTAIVREALLQSGLRLEHLHADGAQALRRACDVDTLELAARLRLAVACCRGEEIETLLPPDIQMLGDREAARLSARQADGEAQPPVAEELDQLLSQQNCDGGWSAKQTQNAGSDPDVTGAVLEALSLHGVAPAHAAMRRGAEFICSSQRGDGSWNSATGVRLVHGTSLAVRGLIAASVPPDDPAVAAGVNWLIVHQQESGGWGEAAATATADEYCEIVPAAASAIQTAWAVSALVAAGLAMDEATLLGVQFLLETQEDDGDWRDEQFALRDPSGAGWYRSDLRTTATALRAIAEWAVIAAREQASLTPACFKLVAT
jgi:hypothetical protein